jgi:hypothetical protein
VDKWRKCLICRKKRRLRPVDEYGMILYKNGFQIRLSTISSTCEYFSCGKKQMDFFLIIIYTDAII